MAKGLEVNVTYVTSDRDTTVRYNDSNYSDVDKIEAGLEEVLGSDDFWIDDIWIDELDIKGVKWTEILEDKGRVNQEILSKLFEENPEELALKLSFQWETERKIDFDTFDDIYVYNASKDDWKYGNFDSKYPEGLLDEWAETYYPDLLKALEKANAESYFEWARVFSDNEVNGDFESEVFGEFFVYKFN